MQELGCLLLMQRGNEAECKGMVMARMLSRCSPRCSGKVMWKFSKAIGDVNAISNAPSNLHLL